MTCKTHILFLWKSSFWKSHVRKRGALESFFVNCILVIFSDVSMFAKNDFLDVFETSQEVSQDSF